jgi:hypothetical protein
MSIQIVSGLEAQPEFPANDLSYANAQYLELLMASQPEVEFSHTTAEKMAWVYRVGHPSMRQGLENSDLTGSIREAIDHGVITYEAICMLMSHLPESSNYYTVKRNALIIANVGSTDHFIDYVSEARSSFTEELPRTAAVVHEASKRFFGSVACYAIDGAAMAYRFEQEAVA